MEYTERIPPENSLIRLIDILGEGVPLSGGYIYAKSIGTGEFKEERRLELYFRRENDESRLLRATIFPGRPEFFRPWVEITNIQNRMLINRKTVVFPDSDLEIMLHQLVVRSMTQGGKIFVEYEHDIETRHALEIGVPAPATRIGHILFLSGVTGFRDGLHPDNRTRGCRKLQGEKAGNGGALRRHISAMDTQLKSFLQSRSPCRSGDVIDRASRRAKAIIEIINEKSPLLPC